MESSHDSELSRGEKAGRDDGARERWEGRRGELLGKMGKQGDPGIAAGPTLEMQYGISALPSFPSHSSDDQLQFSSSQFS